MTGTPAPRGSRAPGDANGPARDTVPGLARADAAEERTEAREPFAGLPDSECGEHRPTGHRAWCYRDGEWCSPDAPCRGCERPLLLGLLASIWLYVDWRYVTRQLTTQQKELWADAIESTADPEVELTVDRWWRE